MSKNAPFTCGMQMRQKPFIVANFNSEPCIYDESVIFSMNIGYSEANHILDAKTCGCKTSGRVAYSFVHAYHGLSIERKEILIAEIEACERLLKYADEQEGQIVRKEIAELKLALDLMT